MVSDPTEEKLNLLLKRMNPNALDKFDALPAPLQSKILDLARDSIQFHTSQDSNVPKKVKHFETPAEKGIQKSNEDLIQLTELMGIKIEELKPATKVQVNSKYELEESQNAAVSQLALPLNTFSKDHKEMSMGTVKLEITSSRESFLQAGGCLSAVMAFVFVVSEADQIWFIIAIGAMIYFLKTLFQTDDYLVVEPHLQKIRYHKEFKGKVKLEDFLSFSQIAFLAVDGKKHENDKKVSWNYQLVAVTVDGDVIPLSDEKSCEFFDCFSFTAALCKKVGLQLAPGASPETALSVIGSGTRLQIDYIKL